MEGVKCSPEKYVSTKTMTDVYIIVERSRFIDLRAKTMIHIVLQRDILSLYI